MPPKRAPKKKADQESDSDDDASSGLFVRGEEKRPNRHDRGKSLSRLEEYDKDEGRESSRDFQRWSDWLKKIEHAERTRSKASISDFQKKVGSERQQMQKLLKKKDENLKKGNDKRVSTFERSCAAALEQALLPSNKEPQGSAHGGVSLFQEAQSIISDSQALLRWFKDTDESLKNHQLELPGAAWKKDRDDIKELLDCGREHGVRIIEGRLAPGRYVPAVQGNAKLRAHDEMAASLFKESRQTREETWGTVAAEQVKRMKNLAATVTVPTKAFR